MGKERQDKVEEKKEKYLDKAFLCFLGVMLILFIVYLFIGTWSEAIEKDYLSKLTPEERLDIQEAERQREIEKQIEQEEANTKSAESLEGWLNIISFPIPLWLAGLFFFAGYFWGNDSRRYW